MAPVKKGLTRCSHMRSEHNEGSIRTLSIPYTSYRGAFIGDHYQLQQLRLQTEFLDIFSVVCLCGRVFEAQAFSLSCPCRKLLDSRKRRMKRIYRSSNFVDVFEEFGKRFLVTKVDRTEKEWRDVCQQVVQGGEDFASNEPARLLGFEARCCVEDRRVSGIRNVSII